jgi:putative transposase
MAKPEPYPSDMTDAEWAVLEALVPGASKLGRPARYPKRLIINVIFYLVRSGCSGGCFPGSSRLGASATITSACGRRRRHLLVDTLGLIHACVVHNANIQDRDGARLLLEPLAQIAQGLKVIWADGAYRGKLIEWMRDLFAPQGACLEIVKRTDDLKGFKVLPKRWIVERTFGWLSLNKRLSKDYETSLESSKMMILIAMSRLMLARISTQPTF